MKKQHRNIKDEDLVEKRRNRHVRFVLTGGTGFLGSHLMAALLLKGYQVSLLVRPPQGFPARIRVKRVFDWLNIDPSAFPDLRIIEADLNLPDFGMDKQRYAELTLQTDEIIHCASDTSFSERKRKTVQNANILNLTRLLKFAVNGNCYFLHLVSTAYVAGANAGSIPEKIQQSHTFTNVYEESKYHAEKIALSACGQNGIRLAVYRPSIVYGDSRTGKTQRFNAMYYPVRMLLFLKNLYEKDIRMRGINGAKKLGIYNGRNRTIQMPIRIETPMDGSINMIPVDHFTSAFIAIMEEVIRGGIFHITAPNPRDISDLIDYVRRFFGIEGVRAVAPGTYQSAPPSRLETLFNRYTLAYKPYMGDQRRFESRNAEAILHKRKIICPDFDYHRFVICMQYALKTNWGKTSGEENNETKQWESLR